MKRDWEFKEFNSFKDAEESERSYYKRLTGNERLKITLQIMEPYYAAASRLKRIHRTSKEHLIKNKQAVGRSQDLTDIENLKKN